MRFLQRVWRSIFSVRMLGRFLFVCACLVTLAALFTVEENWRGKWAWERYKRELEAQGEHLDPAYYIPPQVPDNKNFAMTPLFKPLYDYTRDPKSRGTPPVLQIRVDIKDGVATLPEQKTNNGGWQTGNYKDLQAWQAYYRAALPKLEHRQSPAEEVLAALGGFDAPLAELREAMATRPLSRFPIYEDGVATPLWHITALQQLEKVIALRAEAELRLNRSGDALADMQIGFRLFDSIRDEPFLISELVRVSVAAILIGPVWEGIASHRWTDAQLVILQTQLQQMNFLPDYLRSLRMERAESSVRMSAIYEDPHLANEYGIMRFWKGWIYQSEIIAARETQQLLESVDIRNQRVDMQQVKRNEESLQDRVSRHAPYTALAAVSLPVLSEALRKSALMQTWVNEAVIACDIERYRLAHGTLPATLDELHMTGLPRDIINGQPLHYRVKGTDDYLLYSVGWKEADNGGKIVRENDGRPDWQKSDWVWSLKPL